MIQISKLENGITVISDNSDVAETVSVGVWVGVGSRNEKPEDNGISHVLEHMAFKGTTTRSVEDIARAVEDVGGYMNAYTGQNMTAYYVKALKNDLKMAITVVADILQNSTIPAEEWAKEKGVILQEINMVQDQPDEMVFEHYIGTAYKGQALGRPVIGTVDTVSNFTSERILGYMKSMYQGRHMIVSVSGAVNHAEFVDLCQELFKGVTNNEIAAIEPAKFTPGDIRVMKKHEQVNLVLGFEGVSYNDPDLYTTAVLANILGGGMMSRLFMEIREKRGLVYTVSAGHSPKSDSGNFYIYAGTGEKQVAELMPVLCDEIVKVIDTMREDEIARARAQIKARTLMKLENIATHAENNAVDLLVHGRVVDQAELIKEIDAVNGEELKRVAGKMFSKKPVFASLGPIGNVMSYEEVCQRLKLN